jgi:hypothetical protein
MAARGARDIGLDSVMPAEYRIDRERAVVFSRAFGVVTDEDLRANRKALLADPAFKPDLSQLYDFSEVTQADVSGDAVRSLGRDTSYSAVARRAIVAPSDLQFGLARMFQLVSEVAPAEVAVFRSVEEARRWLDIEDPSSSGPGA